MPIELAARTDAGGRLVATAERLSETLAANAALHDRDGSFPFEAVEALKAARYFAAPVPVDLGGLGVCSAHDLVVASSRLARGDALRVPCARRGEAPRVGSHLRARPGLDLDARPRLLVRRRDGGARCRGAGGRDEPVGDLWARGREL